MSEIRFENRVAIVTGAGNGLGRSHALELARRGAKVVVNDVGGGRDGSGTSQTASNEVVETIRSMGGEAISHGADVSNFDDVKDMVEQTVSQWGRVDILINNAGILRDKSFAKMDMDDFKRVLDIHLMGAVYCTKAVWDIMREQEYGRIVMTTSASGLYGNFGQANYSTAKMAVIGLMNTLVQEGANRNIRVNALSPTAGTRMTKDLLPDNVYEMMTSEAVSAGAMLLCHEDAPNRYILCAGVGGYSSTRLFETEGIYLPQQDQNPETILEHWDSISDISQQSEMEAGSKQIEKFLIKAMNACKPNES